MTEHKPAWEATWKGFAEVLAADRDKRLRQERTNRATTELTNPPKARSHAERMAAAQGVHVHGDNIRTDRSDRRRIIEHRDCDE